MVLGKEELKFVRDLFSHYYRVAPVKLPEDLSSREFAFQTLETNIYIRHMSFLTEGEVRAYLVMNTPRQAYYSTARYLNPAAVDYSDAGWQGSEIMFDIDADKLPGCRTQSLGENVEVVTDECIEVAKNAVKRLIYILEYHMGFGEDELMIYFSGNRGFHIVVSTNDPDWLTLSSKHRVELADYICARGIEIKRLTEISPKTGVQLVPPKPENGGWRSLITVFSKNAELSEENVRALAIAVDPLVTQDISRLIRIPNSLNGKSGLVAKLLNVSEVDSFKLDKSVSPFEGYAIIKPRVDFKGVLIGEEVELSKGVSTRVEISTALYLILNNLATITRYELSSIKNPET